MLWSEKAGAAKVAGNPLPPKIAALLRESWWLALVAVAVYLLLILATFNPQDPGWSHSVREAPVQNWGGAFGAWLADVLLSLFGRSAYWFIALCGALVAWAFKRIEVVPEGGDRRSYVLALIGFFVVLLASAGIEAMGLKKFGAILPQGSGGFIGEIMGGAVSRTLGRPGGLIILLLTFAAGLSLFTRVSWLTALERLGEWTERAFLFVIAKWQERQDRRAGEQATIEREEVVEVSKKKLVIHEPVKIAPPPVEIQKSPRAEREKQVPLFDNLPDSLLPPLGLLDEADRNIETMSAETLEFTSRLIEKKLLDFGVEVKVVAAYPGPVITRYEIEPAVGVKGNQIINLVRDLARALSVISIRVVETIPGKSYMGLEIPNPTRQTVRLTEILSSQVYADMGSPLTMALGKDIAGHPVVADLARMPHLLVAGTTGSGKSVGINAMILSLVYKSPPSQVRLILVDPKMLELSVYEGIPHLLAPVVTDMRQAANALNWCVAEMERRYKLMSSLGVRNLAGFNQKIRDAEKAKNPIPNPLLAGTENPEPLHEMSLIVVVIDELADLMMVVGKKVEELIARLAQKARAAGIHLILATQRPSVDVITGLIKANIPTRIAFQVSAKVDSRTILDQMGAEALLGQGDMLFLPPGVGLTQRVHGAYVADHEVHKVVDYLKQLAQPQYVEDVLEGPPAEDEGGLLEGGGGGDGESDPLYDQACAIVLKTRRASISLVQRHLRIGYNRAARLIEQMERAGMVSAMQTNGNREVLVPASAGAEQ
ncbi:MAG TPA: DNA translocase FtsK 4TM domain-containing protein [Burkholderiales bacterium]|nr:DNA translocase FtsK 4TM domain-containing protein [Burkholderiales bacterium]